MGQRWGHIVSVARLIKTDVPQRVTRVPEVDEYKPAYCHAHASTDRLSLTAMVDRSDRSEEPRKQASVRSSSDPASLLNPTAARMAASFRVSATALLPSAAPRQAHRRAATSSRGPLLRGGPSWFPRTERVVSALVFGGTAGRGRPQGEAVTMKTDIPETVIHRHSTCS